jgi:hypothetical protein
VLKEELQQQDRKEPYQPTKEDVNYWFKLINRTIYFGELTPFSKITIKRMNIIWAAVVYDDEIKNSPLELHLNAKFPNKRHFIEVLAHEMVHKWQMEINLDSGNHNKHFFGWRNIYAEHGLKLTRLL